MAHFSYGSVVGFLLKEINDNLSIFYGGYFAGRRVRDRLLLHEYELVINHSFNKTFPTI